VQATPVNQDETPPVQHGRAITVYQRVFFLQIRIDFFFFLNIVGVKGLPFSRAGAPAHLAVSNGKPLTPALTTNVKFGQTCKQN